MSHSYKYEPSGLHFVSCDSQAEAAKVAAQCVAEGFNATVVYWGSCSWEVQYCKG